MPKQLVPEQIVKVTHRREVDEARQEEIDGILSDMHDLINIIERRRDAIDRDIERRDQAIRDSEKTGPDPVEVVTLAIHRAVHGDSEAKSEALDRLRGYARAVVVDLSSAGYLTIPDTKEPSP